MINTRSELLFDARMGEWDKLKELYLIQTYHEHNEEVDNNAYSWYQTGDDVSLEEIFDDLIGIYSNSDYEDYLCTEESANCVMRYLGYDYNKYSLYDFAEEIYAKYMEYKKESTEE